MKHKILITGKASGSCLSFSHFKNEIKDLMMLDNLDEETKEEYINEWYIFYREQDHYSVSDFVKRQFPSSEVNKNTHDFWVRTPK